MKRTWEWFKDWFKPKKVYKDQVTLKRIDKLHPDIRQEVHEIYTMICRQLNGKVICRFTSTFRSELEQNDLYAQGRTRPGLIVTWSEGGESFHNYGLAVDFTLLVDRDGNGTYEEVVWKLDTDFDNDLKPDWMEVVTIFKSFGWEWGGDWSRRKRDNPHVQLPLMSIYELQKSPKINGYPILEY